MDLENSQRKISDLRISIEQLFSLQERAAKIKREVKQVKEISTKGRNKRTQALEQKLHIQRLICFQSVKLKMKMTM